MVSHKSTTYSYYLLLTTCSFALESSESVTKLYLLLTTHYSLLTTYYSLLTTYYSLLTTYYGICASKRRTTNRCAVCCFVVRRTDKVLEHKKIQERRLRGRDALERYLRQACTPHLSSHTCQATPVKPHLSSHTAPAVCFTRRCSCCTLVHTAHANTCGEVNSKKRVLHVEQH